MSDFELDGSRPMMASISLKALRDIISLLEYELTDGEFESDAEFSKIKELLDECRDSAAGAGKSDTIVWHPVKLVPFDPEKHADLFEDCVFDDKPKLVWEGDLPELDIDILVTIKVSIWEAVTITRFTRDEEFCWFETYEDSVLAWAELPEPYKPEDS